MQRTFLRTGGISHRRGFSRRHLIDDALFDAKNIVLHGQTKKKLGAECNANVLRKLERCVVKNT